VIVVGVGIGEATLTGIRVGYESTGGTDMERGGDKMME